MTVTIKHALGSALAKQRLEGFVDVLQKRYGHMVAEKSQAWQGERLVYRIVGVKRREFTGSVTASATEAAVSIEGRFTFIERMALPSIIKSALAEALRGE